MDRSEPTDSGFQISGNSVDGPFQPTNQVQPTNQGLSPGPCSRVTYRAATHRDDYEGAFRILQTRYLDSGLTRDTAAQVRVMPYHFWPQTQVFIAVDDHRVIGSVSLVRDSQEHGLPMESTYRDSINRLRSTPLRLAEVCCLCVGAEKSYSSGELFSGLTRIMMFHARFSRVDSLVAVVHPRHGKFYRAAMGFAEIGGLASYRQVAGQPGVPILGSVNDQTKYRLRWRQNYFVGQFTDEQLRAHTMSEIDREYFRQQVANNFPGTTRRNAA